MERKTDENSRYNEIKKRFGYMWGNGADPKKKTFLEELAEKYSSEQPDLTLKTLREHLDQLHRR